MKLLGWWRQLVQTQASPTENEQVMTVVTPTKQTPADAMAAVLAAHPGATAAELADAAGNGRSTAAKALAAMASRRAATSRRGEPDQDGSSGGYLTGAGGRTGSGR